MPIGHTKVRINLGAWVADDSDPDDLTQDIALSGGLMFTPMMASNRVVQYDDGGQIKGKMILPVGPIPLGPLGTIAYQTYDYVKVIAPTTATTNLSSLQYRVDFVDIRNGETRLKLEPIYFWAVPDEEINLIEQMNVAPSPTAVLLSRGPRGYGVVGAEVDANGDLVLLYGSDSGPVPTDPVPFPDVSIPQSATAPASPVVGDLWLDTSA